MQGPPADALRPGEVRRRRWQRRVGRGPQQGAPIPICRLLPTATWHALSLTATWHALSLTPALPPSPHPLAGTLPARGRQVPHLEPAQPGSLFKLELAGIKRRAEKATREWAGGLQAGCTVCKCVFSVWCSVCAVSLFMTECVYPCSSCVKIKRCREPW